MTDPDVVVIGGGPGGSTAATMLARKGWNVRLYEREKFPREHIGESLLPATIPILEELGALPAIQAAGFLPKFGATMIWGTSPEPWSWYFRETNPRNPSSFQVWRPQFDQILLENTRAHGVDVREGSRVLDVLFEAGRAVGVRVADGGREQDVACRFVVDASGQQGLLGRKLSLRKSDEKFRNLAIYAYYEGAERLPHPDETNILVESYSEGWTWVIPLHTGQASVGFVMDSKIGQGAIAKRGAEATYEDQVAKTAKTAGMLRTAVRASHVHVIRDWSYVSERIAGDGYALVGDAACFIDPLFSTGVHLAMTAGVMGAAYVTTALKNPEMRDAAGREYQELYYRQYSLFRELAALFYASNRTVDSYFWEARRILDTGESLEPRTAFIRAAAGQSPKGYERMVFEHGEVPGEFRETIAEIEGDRRERTARLNAVPASERQSRVLAAVPRLANGTTVERRPVLADGEFTWGAVIVAPERETVPVSGLVARLAMEMDGTSTLGELVERLELPKDSKAQVEALAARAAEILFIDGTIAELHGL